MAKSEVKKIGIVPLSGYILVSPESGETTTASGIVLPESAQEKPAQGKVVAIGAALVIDGREYGAPVSLGDRVVYKKWGGDDIKIHGIEYKLVKFEDLMAVIED